MSNLFLQNIEKNKEACGTISYLLWGGKSAKTWALSKLKQLKIK